MKRIVTILFVLAVLLNSSSAAMRKPAKVKVLNNLVSELLNVSGDKELYAFTNPRDGWVFVSSTADVQDGDVVVSVPSAPSHSVFNIHRAGQAAVQEAMHYLPAGQYDIKVQSFGKSRLRKLIVRAIPELFYSNFESQPLIGEFPKYTWEWLEENGILANTTTIIGNEIHPKPVEDRFAFHYYNIKPLKQWKAKGRRWLTECEIPGLHDPNMTAQEAFDYWSSRPGMANPDMDGIIVDEFYNESRPKMKNYPKWFKAMEMFAKDKRFEGKAFYPYCAGGYKGFIPLIRKSVELGNMFATEQYLREQPTEQEDWEYIRKSLAGYVDGLSEVVPGANRQVIFALGLMTLPEGTFNTDPSVSNKTHLDMQMWTIANDPNLMGTYGIFPYLSKYADEEYLRFYFKLCRHYCIEGKKERFSNDPYILGHIDNPDFDDGLTGWEIEEAEPGSIAAKTKKGLGYLQGRYAKFINGDNYLWMKRSPAGANKVTQRIRNLEPGRYYSVKMITSDLLNFTTQKWHKASLKIDGVEPVADRSFVHQFSNRWGRHWLSNEERQAKRYKYFNYHYQVFKARSEQAQITISDKAGQGDQELMVNFIEVEPYFY
ncbi:hypothetical protein ACFL3G_07725 [Planctomycetota bacterium]